MLSILLSLSLLVGCEQKDQTDQEPNPQPESDIDTGQNPEPTNEPSEDGLTPFSPIIGSPLSWWELPLRELKTES